MIADPITAQVWIDAPPDRVFPFFTDPARITRWLGHTAQLDPRTGGRFAVDIGDSQLRGDYLELDPPHRVVFTWGHAGSAEIPPGSTRVEVALAEAKGGTTVTLTHHDLPNDFQREDHAKGWREKLDGLALAAG